MFKKSGLAIKHLLDVLGHTNVNPLLIKITINGLPSYLEDNNGVIKKISREEFLSFTRNRQINKILK